MFEIYYRTHFNNEGTVNVIDPTYARVIFKGYCKCIDAAQVVMSDGLTGEVLDEWKPGQPEKNTPDFGNLFDGE